METVLVPNIQSQIDGVTALGAPSGEEQQVSSALELSQQTLEKIEANPELAFGNNDTFAAAASSCTRSASRSAHRTAEHATAREPVRRAPEGALRLSESAPALRGGRRAEGGGTHRPLRA